MCVCVCVLSISFYIGTARLLLCKCPCLHIYIDIYRVSPGNGSQSVRLYAVCAYAICVYAVCVCYTAGNVAKDSRRRARDSRAPPVAGGADGCDARALSAQPTAMKSLRINELP